MNQLRTRARQLRQNSTDVEKLLWRRIRMWQLDGHKFRRQQPLGKYIVDFVCLEKRLIVELDGGQHAGRIDSDSDRDDWLRSQGFIILRFWNHEVLENTQSVVEKIYKTLKSTPLPHSFPARGKEADLSENAAELSNTPGVLKSYASHLKPDRS